MEINNEELFWKVFHSVVIRNNIFEHIKSMDLRGCAGERIQFKNINSLGWMIMKDQLPLLKFKIKAGDPIGMNEEFVSLLTRNCFLNDDEYNDDVNSYNQVKELNWYTNEFSKKNYKNGDELIDDSIEIKRKSEEYKSIYVSLLQSNYFQMLQYKLIDIIVLEMNNKSVSKEGLEFFDILTDELLFNEDYCNSIIIDTKTIELVLEFSKPTLFFKLISNLKNRNLFHQVITNEFKNKSVSLVNKYYMDEMFEYILNTFNSYYELFNVPTDSNYDGVFKLDQILLFSIKSIKIQDQLFYLNYFKVKNGNGNINEKLLNQINEYLDDSNDFMLNLDQGKEYCSEIRFKNLFKLYSKIDDDIYKKYLFKYDQPIYGLNDRVVWVYTLFSKSINGLNYLISNGFVNYSLKFQYKNYNNFYFDELNISSNDEQRIPGEFSYDFIELYTTHYQFIKNKEFDKQLLDYLFSIESNIEYQIILSSIIETNDNKELIELIPNKWSNISCELKEKIKKSNIFLIQDTDTIDLIFQEYEYIKLFLLHNLGHVLIKFESYQLIEYLKLNYGNELYFYGNYINEETGDIIIDNHNQDAIENHFKYSFTKAINDCDIESLMKMDELLGNHNIKFDKFSNSDKSIDETKYSKFVLKKIKGFKKINDSHQGKIKIHFNYQQKTHPNKEREMVKLFEYLNSSGYKLFTGNLLKKLIIEITRLIDDDIEFLKLFNINFQQFPKETIELLLESISSNISPNIVELILSNEEFNLFTSTTTYPILEPIIKEWEQSSSFLNNNSFYSFNNHENEFKNYLQSCIYYYVKGKEWNGPYVCYSYQSANDIESCIVILLNYLKRIKGSTITTTDTTLSMTIYSTTTIKVTSIYNTIEKFINNLFERLIKIKNVDFYSVEKCYHYIKSNWLSNTNTEFKFQHSQYHVFFYLCIRSSKFEKYLMYPNINYTEFYDINLSPSLFSFDFIFNSSFLQISRKLKTNLIFKDKDIDVKIEKGENYNDYQDNIHLITLLKSKNKNL